MAPGELDRAPAVHHGEMGRRGAGPEGAPGSEELAGEGLRRLHAGLHVVAPDVEQFQMTGGARRPEGLLDVHVGVVVAPPGRHYAVHRPQSLQARGQRAGMRRGGQQIDAVVPEEFHTGFRQANGGLLPEFPPAALVLGGELRETVCGGLLPRGPGLGGC